MKFVRANLFIIIVNLAFLPLQYIRLFLFDTDHTSRWEIMIIITYRRIVFSSELLQLDEMEEGRRSGMKIKIINNYHTSLIII